MGRSVILLHHLTGGPFGLNSDLIERAEATPDTVLTLVDGNKYVVAETLDEVVARVQESRASIIALAEMIKLDRPERPVVLRLLSDEQPDA
jgi:flagellar protein FlbD